MLLDDHGLFRDGVALMLQVMEPGCVVQHASSLEQALQRLSEGAEPELILLDLGLPGIGGVEALHILRERADGAAIMVLSGTEDMELVRACIEAGAMGFVHKSADSRTMLAAVRQVLGGVAYLPPTFEPGAPVPGAAAAAVDTVELTPRQREVLARLIKGKPNKAIARELGINETTVKSHVTGVLQALGVSNRTEAVYAVRKLGIRFS